MSNRGSGTYQKPHLACPMSQRVRAARTLGAKCRSWVLRITVAQRAREFRRFAPGQDERVRGSIAGASTLGRSRKRLRRRFPVTAGRFPDQEFIFPDRLSKFPVPISRELSGKPQYLRSFLAGPGARICPKIALFPVFSLMIRESSVESSSHQTASSAPESLSLGTLRSIRRNSARLRRHSDGQRHQTQAASGSLRARRARILCWQVRRFHPCLTHDRIDSPIHLASRCGSDRTQAD